MQSTDRNSFSLQAIKQNKNKYKKVGYIIEVPLHYSDIS